MVLEHELSVTCLCCSHANSNPKRMVSFIRKCTGTQQGCTIKMKLNNIQLKMDHLGFGLLFGVFFPFLQ